MRPARACRRGGAEAIKLGSTIASALPHHDASRPLRRAPVRAADIREVLDAVEACLPPGLPEHQRGAALALAGHSLLPRDEGEWLAVMVGVPWAHPAEEARIARLEAQVRQAGAA